MISKRNYLFGTTVLAGMLAMAAPAMAQDPAPAQDDATEVEEIIVTGSLIRRDPTTAPTPIIQATREEILQSGEQNIVDFLTDIPALQNSLTPEDTTGGFVGIGGLATLNLRNLGGQRTLVLVDGRRHVGGQRGTPTVDVDTIPTPLIQSVEIITGGASSLYGADAVSGVVNFIMRTDYEGIELDVAASQLAQNTDSRNERISLLVGKNLFDDRLNVYAFGEYQTSDIVNDRELDIDWIQNEERLVNVDFDTAANPNDGVRDIERVSGLRTLSRPFGGILTIANGQQPSPTSDPDIGYSFCGSNNGTTIAPLTAGQNNTFGNTGCFPINAGFSFRFNPGGAPVPVDVGLGLLPNGTAGRTLTVGGNGDSLVIQDVNRLPEQENKRFQVGANFKLTDEIELFAEYKYVDEYNLDVFQPHFSDVGLRALAPGESGRLTSLLGGTIGLDNAYLDPALRTRIETNVRTVYAANGTVLGTQADPRAAFRLFSYDLGFRPQTNERELNRFVGGVRGDFDQIAFLKDGQWEIGYTWGQTDIVNNEPETIDLERWFFSADAVRDTANVTGRGVNSIVCRVQILAAQGRPILNSATGTNYAANDPTITGCVPQNIFGLGGQAVARDYILTDFLRTDTNTQRLAGFISGNLWDFWGAGPIGIALGGEYREERWESTVAPFGPRVLFGNSGANLAEVGFDVSEAFIELRIPLLTDVPFAETLEASGAFRYSDYSTGQSTETYSTSVFWRPISDIAFRGTYGEASRAPTLFELFSPLSATFPNINDSCSRPVIDNTADARVRANRIRNCAARGVPTTYVDPFPNTSNLGGFSGSNPNLLTETSTSYTLSAILTPSFFENFDVVLDYYSIDIEDAIATLGIQQLVGLCYDEDASSDNACATFQRDPVTFEINGFIQGPFNFAGLRARGVDFQANYRIETEDLIGRDWGSLNFALAGNYLIRRQDFTSPTDPNAAIQIDGTANNPRVRFRNNTTWTKGPLQVSWRVDFQRAYEIIYLRNIVTNTDSRDFDFLTVPNFWQHDVSFRYNLTDDVTLRGGVTNLFDAEPTIQAGLQDQYDLFGRRFFFGVNFRY